MNKTLKTALSLFALLTLISCADNQIVSSVINNSSVNPDNSGSIFSSEPTPSSVISSDKQSSVAPSSKVVSSTPAPSSEKPSSQVPSSEPVSSAPISSSEPIQSSVPTPSSEPVISVPVSSTPIQSSEPVSSSAPISSAPVSSSSEQPSSSTPVGVYYHVTFVNYDETLLYEVDVLEGTEAVYQGEEPTKPEDDDYTYTFKGWDKDLTSITSDTTAKAEFESKSKWSQIIWF